MQKYLFKINSKGLAFINNPQRNKDGRISTRFFKNMIVIYCIEKGKYNPNIFKKYISSLNILNKQDKELMPTRNYPEWKHYIDAAKQELIESKILIEEKDGIFALNNESLNIQLKKNISLFEINATN